MNLIELNTKGAKICYRRQTGLLQNSEDKSLQHPKKAVLFKYFIVNRRRPSCRYYSLLLAPESVPGLFHLALLAVGIHAWRSASRGRNRRAALLKV